MDTADILAPEQYTLTGEGQWVTTGKKGLNFRGHLDQSVTDSTQLRLTLGTGVNSLQGAFNFKWVPVPDFDQQPGFGVIFSANYSKIDSDSLLAFLFKALVSKNFATIYGDTVPYAALSAGVQVQSNKDTNPAQLSIGARFRPNDWNQTFLMAEMGMEVTDSFSYLSFGMQWDFNNDHIENLNEKIGID
jgi:hypothetical protein